MAIHTQRSGDSVQFGIEGKGNVYMTHADARTLFNGLGRILRDLERVTPAQSKANPVTVTAWPDQSKAESAGKSQRKRF